MPSTMLLVLGRAILPVIDSWAVMVWKSYVLEIGWFIQLNPTESYTVSMHIPMLTALGFPSAMTGSYLNRCVVRLEFSMLVFQEFQSLFQRFNSFGLR